jgi:hypothetical protein
MLVPMAIEHKNGQVFLVKQCPKCGPSETLISSDAERYDNKRRLSADISATGCHLNCTQCGIHKKPNMLFVDLTNRCNLNCPICINNTPSMGFLFEPPIEYFDTIFKYYAQFEEPPAIQLFGGEPTVRNDLLDIIKLALSYGLRPRLVTNGLRLADPEYCRQIVESRATILIAYDGADPETYRVHRGNEKCLQTKLKAIENIGRVKGAKVVLMTLMAKGFNDQKLTELFQFCHERKFIRAVDFMPLAHSWTSDDIKIEAQRTTLEDVELAVQDAFPDDRIDFLPAAFWGTIRNIIRVFTSRTIPFAGAHPNCESMYLLVSDGGQYVPISRYLKTSLLDLAADLIALEKRLGVRLEKPKPSAGGVASSRRPLRNAVLKARLIASLAVLFRRHVRAGSLFKGRGTAGKTAHAARFFLKLALGRRTAPALEKHTNAQAVFQVIVLPFEDLENMETERLELCPAGFAYVDPDDGQVKHVPSCAWRLHKKRMMMKISEHYKTKTPEAREPTLV